MSDLAQFPLEQTVHTKADASFNGLKWTYECTVFLVRQILCGWNPPTLDILRGLGIKHMRGVQYEISLADFIGLHFYFAIPRSPEASERRVKFQCQETSLCQASHIELCRRADTGCAVSYWHLKCQRSRGKRTRKDTTTLLDDLSTHPTNRGVRSVDDGDFIPWTDT